MSIKLSLFFLLILNFIIYTSSNAQQNLFNIPSGDISNAKKIFYQHQFNIYSNKLESKAHFVYGLGKGWDIGANLVGKGLYFSPNWRLIHNDNTLKGAVYPILMGTIQKQFVISEHFQINAGTQIGWNLSRKITNKKFNHFSYLLGSYHIGKSGKLITGIYTTNEMFVGGGNTFGIMGGYEFKVSKKVYLMGDWVSGNNEAAVMVLGGMVNVSKRIQLCAGWQIPNTNTIKPMGLVLEFNLMGWDLF
jgi:hypothetical protein